MQKFPRAGRIILIILSLLGAAVMADLIYVKQKIESSGFCEIGAYFSCDLVNQTIYSEFMGIPIAFLGLFFFLGALGVLLWRYDAFIVKAILFFSIVFLGPSVYLSAMEYFVIKSVCIACESAKIIIIAIAGTSFWLLGSSRPVVYFFNSAIVLGLIAAGGTYLIQTNTGPGNIYVEFARCLDEKGYIMYGSITCASCARQRVAFGDAFTYIEEIECDPENPESQDERCISKNIKKTPTWIQEDPEGNEVYRFESGYTPLEKLSEVSGCPLQK